MTDVQTQTAPKKKAPAKKASAKKASTKKATATKRPVGLPKKVGVIAAILESISKDKGSTVDETWTVLKNRFPDRDPDGMRKTAMIQSNKQKTSKEVIEGRGTVFYKRR